MTTGMKWISVCGYIFSAAACGRGISSDPGAPSPDATVGETGTLGMNDVTMLLGEDAEVFSPLLAKMSGVNGSGDFVPRDIYARIATSHGDIGNGYDEYEILALRFDLCDRVAPVPCPDGADGSLRVVFQPTAPVNIVTVADVGLHAFYRLPAIDLPVVVSQLRTIARISSIDARVVLGSRSFLSGPATPARETVQALLATYAKPDRLIRLTLMGQDQRTSEPRTVFRGLELHDGQMVDLQIAGVASTEQDISVSGDGSSYQVAPLADAPVGFATTLDAAAFAAAAPGDQRGALDALAAVDNPLLNTQATVQCVSCHVSTYLGNHRASAADIELSGLPDAFHSSHNTRLLEGRATTQPRSLHALSWNDRDIEISQRAVNETANVLDEIERRFPAAQ